jgi:hypothetical protein
MGGNKPVIGRTVQICDVWSTEYYGYGLRYYTYYIYMRLLVLEMPRYI